MSLNLQKNYQRNYTSITCNSTTRARKVGESTESLSGNPNSWVEGLVLLMFCYRCYLVFVLNIKSWMRLCIKSCESKFWLFISVKQCTNLTIFSVKINVFLPLTFFGSKRKPSLINPLWKVLFLRHCNIHIHSNKK